MTKGGSTTSLGPAEEFPILYHLLTSPVMLSPQLRPPSRGLKHKFSMLDFDGPATKVKRYEEADSSVVLQVPCDSPQKGFVHRCDCQYRNRRSRTESEKVEEEADEDEQESESDEEDDAFPSSTTIDDEDLVEELLRKRKKSHRKNLPKQL